MAPVPAELSDWLAATPDERERERERERESAPRPRHRGRGRGRLVGITACLRTQPARHAVITPRLTRPSTHTSSMARRSARWLPPLMSARMGRRP